MRIPTATWLHRGAFATFLLPACSASPGGERSESGTSLTSGVGIDTGAATGEASSSGNASTDPQESQDDGSSAADGGDNAPKFDIGDGSFCEQRPAGIFCDDQTATQCDGNGGTVDTTLCTPDLCVEGDGCVTCT